MSSAHKKWTGGSQYIIGFLKIKLINRVLGW